MRETDTKREGDGGRSNKKQTHGGDRSSRSKMGKPEEGKKRVT